MEFLGDISDLTDLGGMVGALNLYEESPRTNQARVRPFVWSVLLLRGAVRAHEVIASLAPHVNADDRRVWEEEGDITALELTVQQTLWRMCVDEVLRVSEKDPELYVLCDSKTAARKAISVTSTLDAQLPDHFLAELGRSHYRANP